MMEPAVNLFRRLVAVILAVSVSVCCCQASFLQSGLSGCDEVGHLGGAIAAAAACCDGCADGSPTDPEDTDTPGPPTSCQTCCIKGTGLKDSGSTLPPMIGVPAPPLAAGPSLLPLDPPRTAPRRAIARVSVPAPTLLRLRCALLL